MSPRRTRPTVMLLVALAVVAGWAAWSTTRVSNEELLQQARQAYARHDFPAAEAACRQLLQRSPASAEGLLIAARTAREQSRFDDALAHYQRLEELSTSVSPDILVEIGELLQFHLHQASDAEARYRRALQRNPDEVQAINRLAVLLCTEGRGWEALDLLRRQILLREFTSDHLLLVGSGDPVIESPARIDAFLDSDPDDVLPLIMRAREQIRSNPTTDTRELLERILAVAPQQVEAQALLGRTLYDLDDGPRFIRWHAAAPEEHPQVWYVRGLWARRRGEDRVAARCFAESLMREPTQRLPHYQLGQTLVSLGEHQQAAPFLQRAEDILAAEQSLNEIFHARNDLPAMRRLTAQLQHLGRRREAWAWCQIALSLNPQATWAQQSAAELEPAMSEQTGWVVADARLELQSDWSRFPLPAWSDSEESSIPAPLSPANVRWVDVAHSLGIRFQFDNNDAQRTEGRRMFEQLGGGVAVFDLNADGWPDLYFAQGCDWPVTGDGPIDRIYLNAGGAAARDVTLSTGIAEAGFSQGVAAGDFDGDGLDDLYIGNVGRNRLFRNQGDGTFIDVTEESGTAGNEWTSSCLIADLNGDALPDIYSVNYLSGEDVFDRRCPIGDGRLRSCSPGVFDAAQDQLFLNLGDGRFLNVTMEAGIVVPHGKGLGVVAADFAGEGRLDLFIANDQTANLHFQNRTTTPGGPPRFQESAAASGLAFDGDGLSLACMGIAAGDADGDGLCDLFVTNFANESNTLYRQSPQAVFRDVTRQAGLRDAGFDMLGFGTQFLDADLDGWLDLLLVNGHVDDFTFRGQLHEMPPQYFHNAGEGQFVPIDAAALGPYFEGNYLGRAVVRLDWNRDGREDCAVTHLETPAALLLNETPVAGSFLAVRLCGTLSERDAIGTRLQITAAGRSWTQQLTAGDGYLASNERRLVFGLGDAAQIERLVVRWPSGTVQEFSDLPIDSEALIVEGRSPLIREASTPTTSLVQ